MRRHGSTEAIITDGLRSYTSHRDDKAGGDQVRLPAHKWNNSEADDPNARAETGHRYKCSALEMRRNRSDSVLDKLPPRERQIVELLYQSGSATVVQICDASPVRISDSAVRTMLTRLEAKGFVRRTPSGGGYTFAPAVPEAVAKETALRQLVRTFFQNSPIGAASALLGMSEKVDAAELDLLEQAIAKAREERLK